MSFDPDSKHYKKYLNHVMGKKKQEGTLGLVYDLLDDMTNRRGLKQEWNMISAYYQNDIVKKWCGIINKWLNEKEKKKK